MRHVKSGALLAIAMLVGTGSALAGAGNLTTTVTPLTPAVTYAIPGTATTALVTYVGYTVAIKNAGGNTINNIRFTATASVTDAQEAVAFDSVEGISCQTTAPSLSCTIGQLQAGQSAPTFAVFFKAPAKDTVSPLPNGVVVDDSCVPGLDCPKPKICVTGTDCVNFSGVTYYAEGTGGANSVPQNSTGGWVANAVALGTTNPTEVVTALPKKGGTLFTGAAGVANGTDTWTTTVTVPPTAAYTTAAVNENTSAVTCAPDLLTCSTSTLTIPGTFAKLVITLRRDASTITNGAKIANAIIKYDPAPKVGDPRVVYPYQVLSCTDTSYGPLPQVGIPCLNKATAYKANTAPSSDWIGDWEFEIWALDNGKYIN